MENSTSDHQQIREALEPCPFCGSSDVRNVSSNHPGPAYHLHANDTIFAVNCGQCGASVPNRYRNELVVAAWNRRAPRLEAAAAAEYERGRQDGMKQEHALWQMQRIGQEIEAAAVPRTLLEQHDLDQSPEYRKGREDGRALGYEVGYRFATERAAAAVPELSREDVVRLAREAGFEETTYGLNDTPGMYAYNMDIIQRFASLVRSAPVGGNQP